MSPILGMQIISNSLIPETLPVIKLSARCPVSDSFRAEFDAWALELFGVRQYAFVFDRAALGLIGSPAIAMHPNLMARLLTNQRT